MWTCANCGLVNSDESSRCDCATVRPDNTTPAVTLAVPLLAWVHLAAVVVLTLYVAFGPYGYVTRPPRRYHWEPSEAQQQTEAALFVIKTVALVPLYLAFVGARRNWARLILGVITFPLGLLVLLPRSLRQYTGALPLETPDTKEGTVLGIGGHNRT